MLLSLSHWFIITAYGLENPPDNSNPNGCRSSTLKYWKKAISSFMPHQSMAWNSVREEGNPTRSAAVKELIKAVEKKEVRKEGVASKARRPFTHGELEIFLVDLLVECEAVEELMILLTESF